MRSTRSIARLCSRPFSHARAPLAGLTPIRCIRQEFSHIRRPQSSLRQHQAFLPQLCHHSFSTTATCSEAASVVPGDNSAAPQEQKDVPQYQMTFTCKACGTRSSHRITKQGYHKGTVLISCPGCTNRHLISDHLKIFSNEETTLEDMMREKGDLIKRGSLSENGDLELWDDGTQTKHKPVSPRTHAAGNTANSDAAPGSSFKSDS